MRQMAEFCAETCGRVLEIGYGLGMASHHLSEARLKEHVIIEAHPQLASEAAAWARTVKSHRVRVINGWWQTEVEYLGLFDAILFDTSPPDFDMAQNHYLDFVQRANRHLNKNGRLTYISLERNQFSNSHFRLLNQRFASVDLVTVQGLKPPKRCSYWRDDQMIVPCVKAS